MPDLGRRDFLLVALTFSAGTIDAVAFLRLDVLTAVMTGNLVLLGIATGQGAVRSALRTLVALVAYAIGVLVGARTVGVLPAGALWSGRVTRALALEWVLEAAFLGGWILAAAKPDGIGAAALIAMSGSAMGLRAAATRSLAPGTSTTYVTGTLTALLSELSALGSFGADAWRRAAIVVALVAGALSGAIALQVVPILAPAIPLAVVSVVIVASRRL